MNCSSFTFYYKLHSGHRFPSLHSANYHRFIADMIDHCELHDCVEKKLHGQQDLFMGAWKLKHKTLSSPPHLSYNW